MRRTSLLLLAVGLSLVFAAPASASLADRLVADFADDGSLDACSYSEAELTKIEDLIGNDIDAYEPDFRTAIDAMIERRAQGACKKKRQRSGADDTSGTTATPGSSGGTSSGAGAARSAPGKAGSVPAPDQTGPSPLITDSVAAAARSDKEGDAPPFPLLALGALAALMALGGLLFGATRWSGWEPAWADRARHAAAEAGWRASSTWAEFTDFVRFGR